MFDELHINSLAVDPAWRRRGLARRLLVSVLGDAVASGAQSATLEVRRSNEAARALYEGLGFKVDGVRRDYYQHPREDARAEIAMAAAQAAAEEPGPRPSLCDWQVARELSSEVGGELRLDDSPGQKRRSLLLPLSSD